LNEHTSITIKSGALRGNLEVIKNNYQHTYYAHNSLKYTTLK